MEESPLFNCRIEEVPFIVAFLLISLERDKALFKAHSPVYTDDYIENFRNQLAVVEGLVAPIVLTGERKVITKLVNEDYQKVRHMVNRVADYLKLADGSLTLAAEDFGMKGVRAQLDVKNDEGIVKALRILYKNFEDNKTELAKAGYTSAVSAEFENLIADLSGHSKAQTTKKDDRIALTKQNIAETNKLWKTMVTVMGTGKTLAKEMGNDSMQQDYTIASLVKKVRLERKKEEKPEEKK
jgi:hypothetical protein